MASPWLGIVLILATGLVFVILPTALTTFFEYRRKRSVICPELQRTARIGVDAGEAARSSLFGRLRLRVESCTFWPARRGCAQACLQSLDAPVVSFRA